MGPITTGLGEIYMFKVTGKGRSLMELRSILDWEIAPKLRTTPGIVEVNTHGGELKTYEVRSRQRQTHRLPHHAHAGCWKRWNETTPTRAALIWNASNSSR